ncbi:Prospero [Operophtera brumata]|uniref:Prospero n=1 Tax=Operophtera brumata TaxID=104452 RepID=A0A0L7LIF8_OPEBR|nr:Prospero [Operophtera brumata]
MSSEEEADARAPCSDRLLKKQKRARQRVDAGEPRNSYSTLATNGLAPACAAALMSGGLYGAIFEGRQHFNLFGPGYAPAEMLNELLSRTPKLEETGDEAAGGHIAHRVLRDILQNRKKELMRLSPDNNNVLANNNNDEPKVKTSPERPASRDSRPDLDDALMALDSAGDLRNSPPPTQDLEDALLNPKSEPEDRDSDVNRSSPRPSLDVKRARVENIVSTMRSSPAPPQVPQVNGCKKRKLYHPQQHEAERYGPSRAGSVQTLSEDSDDDGDRPPIQQKLVEKNALKSQLRTMQEQLAEMREKYYELRNRMGQESETVDNDGASSDIEQNEDTVPKSEPASPAKEASTPTPLPPATTPNMLHEMKKIMTAKMHAHVAAQGHLPPGFNGGLPLLPHLSQEHMHPQHPHQHLNNAAAINAGSVVPVPGADLEGLAEVLKSEITSSLATLIDSIVTRFVHQRRTMGKQSEAAAIAAERLNKDIMRATRLLDGPKSPASKPPERPTLQMPGNHPVHHNHVPNGNPFLTHNPMLMSQMNGPRVPGAAFPLHGETGVTLGTHRPPTALFQTPPKPLAPLYGMNGHYERDNAEQNEALSLVVTPKKKRHKVTDTRITPRTVSRLLGEGVGHSPESKFPESPSPRLYPGGMALPTSVAITNPSLHESQVFSPYSPFFGAGGGMGRSPPSVPERESPPLPQPPALLHPALLAAAHHASPDYLRHHAHAHVPHHGPPPHHPHHMDAQDHSDCNSTDLPYDGLLPTISFYNRLQLSLTYHSSSHLGLLSKQRPLISQRCRDRNLKGQLK